MSTRDWETEYLALSPELQEVFSSVAAAKEHKKNSIKYNLTEVQFDAYLDIVSNVILGRSRTTEIPRQLQEKLGIGADDAQRILGDLSTFLEPVIKRERNAAEPSRAGLQQLQQNFKALREEAIQTHPTTDAALLDDAPENLPTAAPTSAPETDESPTPSFTVSPAQIKTSYTVEPMRTMEADITRVHGYGAYRDLYPDEAGEQAYKEETLKSAPQDELLKEKPKLAEKPTYGEE